MTQFEFDGEKYKQASKHQKEWGRKLISELDLQGDEEILDLGCGDGALTEHIAMLVPKGRVVGIDASEGMIQTAQKLQQPNLSFHRADIHDIAYENQFHVVFSNAALHWIKNHKRLLENTLKALKVGGRTAWNFASKGTCVNFHETVKTVMDLPAYKEFFVGFEWPWYMPDKEEYVSLIETIGFSRWEVRYALPSRRTLCTQPHRAYAPWQCLCRPAVVALGQKTTGALVASH